MSVKNTEERPGDSAAASDANIAASRVQAAGLMGVGQSLLEFGRQFVKAHRRSLIKFVDAG